MNLFNFTQDDRHLVVIDTRSFDVYMSGFLRKSYWLDTTADDKLAQVQTLFEFIKEKQNMSAEFEKIYKAPKTRRLVVIVDSTYSSLDKVQKYLTDMMIKPFFNKFYVLVDQMAEFATKYKMLILSSSGNKEDHKNDFSKLQANLLENKKNEVLYANSSFPIELEENTFFLGNNFHRNSKRLMEDMGIKYSIEFRYDDDNHNKIDQADGNMVISINRNKLIDFDGIFEKVKECIREESVIFCSNDMKIVSAFAVAYFVWNKKINVNVASIKVFGVLGRTDVDKLIYNQVIASAIPDLTIISNNGISAKGEIVSGSSACIYVSIKWRISAS